MKAKMCTCGPDTLCKRCEDEKMYGIMLFVKFLRANKDQDWQEWKEKYISPIKFMRRL
jgi:hypothetical protein